jgi:hypothetical protein
MLLVESWGVKWDTYVVLNERAASPAVNAKVAVTLRAERTAIVDGSSPSSANYLNS